MILAWGTEPMFFVTAIRSAAGAANYFAKDNYYTQGENAELSTWGGQGAAALGLSGFVDKGAFEALLNSVLPDGTVVNDHEHRRLGLDLTFSMPKSASVLAYVGGDERILEANLKAVKSAMAWVEKNVAEARVYGQNARSGDPVGTGNLVYALFQHDTSRLLDPQAHIHAVVAPITQAPGGVWKALWNGEIYQHNSVIGSIYHAALRDELEQLGYSTRPTGKHGQFEIEGVPRPVLEAHSRRREEILAKSEELGITTPQGQDEVVKRTRDYKVHIEDHDGLRRGWIEKTDALGYDASVAVGTARTRVIKPESPVTLSGLAGVVDSTLRLLRLYLRPSDPLTTNGVARVGMLPSDIRVEMAVASAIRILGQNEATFQHAHIAKTALDLGLGGVTIAKVEARMAVLKEQGGLVEGKSSRVDGVVTTLTTPEHIKLERQVLGAIDRGRGAGTVVMDYDSAVGALQAVDPSRLVQPVALSDEQLHAAASALSSPDRTMAIQGVAGAGKSTTIDRLARVIEDSGRQLLGVAIAGEMVKKLREDSNIEAETVSAFVNRHLAGALRGEGPHFEASKAELAGKILIMDEASLAGTKQSLDILTIAEAFSLDKFLPTGDRAQLLPVEHGDPFASIQAAKVDLAVLPTSLRQKTALLRGVADASRARDIRGSFAMLGDRVVDGGAEFLGQAAHAWLALDPEMRGRTDIYTSGRQARSTINEAVQAGLKAEGTIKGEGLPLVTRMPVHLSREELRYAQNYEEGMTLEVLRDATLGRLAKGIYEVEAIDNRGRVWVSAGSKTYRFDPSRIDPGDRRDNAKLWVKDEILLHEGDALRFGDKDKDRGIHKADRATVIRVDGDTVTIAAKDGTTHQLHRDDPLMKTVSLNYALNMHQAQGVTQDFAIGAMNSREQHLSNARLFHVMVTRVKFDVEIFTNDPTQLQAALARNMGDKGVALSAVGELTLPSPQRPNAAARFAAPALQTQFNDAEMRAYPDQHKGPQQPAPEKVKERGL
jgi:conjugative relaxase-like TrwC/TraI family protein